MNATVLSHFPTPRHRRFIALRSGMLAQLTCLTLACSILPGRPVQAVERDALPAAVHGIWQLDTDTGRDACRRYLAATLGSDEAMWAVTGGLVINPTLLHHLSDMGEGDFVEIETVEASGSATWRIRGRLGIDGDAAADAPLVQADISLNGAMLDLRESVEGRMEHRRYARCGSGG